ncbi:MAG: carbohydrate ABC transporter substrate-binding protein [Clostridia bacterium]|nr:carbohydrate ABC transporter substrate-binding protein [Clostridia bacterium]
MSNRKKRRGLICLGSFLFGALLLLLPACGGGREKKEETVPEEVSAAVFHGSGLALHGDPIADVKPYYDPETETLSVAVILEDGAEARYGRAVFRLSGEDDPVEERVDPLPLPAEEVVQSGILTADGYVLLTASGIYPEQTFVIRARTGDAETVSGPLSEIVGSDRYRPRRLTVGGDGSLWIQGVTGTDPVAVLEPDFSLRTVFPWDDMIVSLAADEADGAWIVTSLYGLQHADRLGNPEDQIPHPSGTLNTVFLMPGEDGPSPACITDRGIEVWDGEEWQLFMDYAESGLTPLSDLLTVLPDRSAAVFVKHDLHGDVLRLYRRRKTADPDAGIRTVEIGILRQAEDYNEAFLRNCIAEFNAEHPNVKVTVTNFGELYGDFRQAKDAMVRDILTGVRRPDMLFLWEEDVFQVMIDHALCLDLTPYIDRDPAVNRETLFGAVLRTMTYDGMIWGMPESIQCHALVAKNSVLGEYAGRESWTLEEELDFIESLPEDVEPLEGLIQSEAIGRLFYYTDLRQFIDMEAGTCSFDSPEAIRLFKWLSTLPATNAEYRKRYSSLNAMFDDLDVMYAEGKIALYSKVFSGADGYAGIPLSFLEENMDNLTMIGYPTVGNRGDTGGIVTSVGRTMMILNTAAYPDDAWAFLSAFLQDPVTSYTGASPLRTVFLDEATPNMTGYNIKWADGTGFVGPVDPAPGRKGIRIPYGWDERYAVADILDRVGTPLLSGIGEEVNAIIAEELSAMSAGVSTPERCAELIQSRVSLWLAERH